MTDISLLSTHDIAVIGPGPVGAVAALLLAHKGFNVTLIGPASPRADGRTVALMGDSWAMLQQVGISDRLAAESAPLAVMRLVDDTPSLFRRPPVEFRAAELGLSEFGFNVEVVALTRALLAAVDAEPRVTRVEASVTDVVPGTEAVRLALAGGGAVEAKLVIGADGRKSRVREAAGITVKEWSYPQVALTTILAHSQPHRDISTEFHTRQGPCTTVPLPGRRSSIVWMVAPDEGERLMTLDDTALASAIEERTHAILGRVRIDGPRGLVPMGGLAVERFTGQRLAIVGEAAHVFPPIGAQGLNLGLRDVATLVEALPAAGSDTGAPGPLTTWDRERALDVRTRTGAVDALNRSLLTDLLPVDFARGFGLLMLESFGPLRRFVMRQGLSPRGNRQTARSA
jgi:2-octaprenyl-6-methoxyphenol hydroxylase